MNIKRNLIFSIPDVLSPRFLALSNIGVARIFAGMHSVVASNVDDIF